METVKKQEDKTMTPYNIITKPLTIMLAIMMASCSQTPAFSQRGNE